MYGAITGSEWGEQSDFSSDKFYDNTLEYLERVAREYHSILDRIRSREWSVERLAENYPASEADVPEKNVVHLKTH